MLNFQNAGFSLFLAMVSIQTGASFAKRLFPEIGPVGTATYRLFFASVLLVFFWRPWRHRWNRRQLLTLAAYGISLGWMNLLFYCALERISLGLVVALEFTGPLAVALYASRKLQDFLWAFLAAAGIFLILPHETHLTQVNSWEGIAFALGAGVCWALYILAGKRIGSEVHSGQATALGMTFAALSVVPVGLTQKGPDLMRPDLLVWGITVAILSSALPYSFEMVALKKLSHKTFSILMSLEPAMAAIAGYLFLHETLSLVQFMAIVLIMIASGGAALFD